MNPEKAKSIALEIKSSREKLVSDILESSELDNMEKVALISDLNIGDYDPWVRHPFAEKYKDEYKKVLEEQFGTLSYLILDDYFDMRNDSRNRGARDDIYSYIEAFEDDLEFSPEFFKDGVTVLQSRTKDHPPFIISEEQFRQDIFDWVKTNKLIGWTFDW